jgi:hypothetical protein
MGLGLWPKLTICPWEPRRIFTVGRKLLDRPYCALASMGDRNHVLMIFMVSISILPACIDGLLGH